MSEITTADTYDLRRRVLSTKDEAETIPEDSLGNSVHLGVKTDDQKTVCIATFFPAECKPFPNVPAVQLRKMGTDPEFAGRGCGRHLIDAATKRFANAGFELIWANARVSALGFYERIGFTQVGDEFISHDIPHCIVYLALRTL